MKEADRHLRCTVCLYSVLCSVSTVRDGTCRVRLSLYGVTDCFTMHIASGWVQISLCSQQDCEARAVDD